MMRLRLVPRAQPSRAMLFVAPLLAVALTLVVGLAVFAWLGQNRIPWDFNARCSRSRPSLTSLTYCRMNSWSARASGRHASATPFTLYGELTSRMERR